MRNLGPHKVKIQALLLWCHDPETLYFTSRDRYAEMLNLVLSQSPIDLKVLSEDRKLTRRRNKDYIALWHDDICLRLTQVRRVLQLEFKNKQKIFLQISGERVAKREYEALLEQKGKPGYLKLKQDQYRYAVVRTNTLVSVTLRDTP